MVSDSKKKKALDKSAGKKGGLKSSASKGSELSEVENAAANIEALTLAVREGPGDTGWGWQRCPQQAPEALGAASAAAVGTSATHPSARPRARSPPSQQPLGSNIQDTSSS